MKSIHLYIAVPISQIEGYHETHVNVIMSIIIFLDSMRDIK